jgi:hypothetical protein
MPASVTVRRRADGKTGAAALIHESGDLPGRHAVNPFAEKGASQWSGFLLSARVS